jgi:hypothetical protein
LPFLTPEVRTHWSSAGAGWLQDDPAIYTGREIWLLAHFPAAAAPRTGQAIPVAGLARNRQAFSDKLMHVEGTLDAAGSFVVRRVDASFESRMESYRTATVAGALFGVALLVACFRPSGQLRFEIRPWIR